MIENAIASGRITADKRQNFAELAAKDFDLAKSILEVNKSNCSGLNQTMN